MSVSSAAKGEAMAIEPEVESTTSPRLVKPQLIPSATLLNIEYPGILTNDSDAATSVASSSHNSLERALSTLHPSTLPPLTSSAHEALRFLARIPNEGLKVVECRLGGFVPPNDAKKQPEASTSGSSHDHLDDVYRAPLIGETVPTHNIVIRIVKRTWRQNRKRRPSESPIQQETQLAPEGETALDPALFGDTEPSQLEQPPQTNGDAAAQDQPNKRSRYTGRVKKEYCVEILGMATNTVRFRSMADFAFQPSIATSDPASDAEPQLDPVMALHRALATMDLKALQEFRVPEQREDYSVPERDGSVRSNLHMVPPAFFSRMDVPFHYAFQQTPYSELRTVPAPVHLRKPPTSASFAHALQRPDVPPGQMQRFVNRVRLSNITPQPFRVGRDTKVPTKPLPDVVRIEHRCEPAVLARLRALLLERPMWSRVALKNQLTGAEWSELHGNNEKVYYALVGYSMVGGPWRDTIVRFGYDVTKDASSRIYQRIFLRSGAGPRESRLTAQASTAGTAGDDEDAEPEDTGVARSSVVPLPNERTRTTHLFDGTSLHRHVGNFQLCDIEDPLIKPYIWRTNDEDLPEHSVVSLPNMGTPWLRSTSDPETGWYTRRALELIRALVTARFKSLVDTGTPLEPQALERIVQRLRQRWSEEDAATTPADQHEMEEDGETVASHAAHGEPLGQPQTLTQPDAQTQPGAEADANADTNAAKAIANAEFAIDPSLM